MQTIFPCEGCAVSLRDVLSKIQVQQSDFTGQLTQVWLKREFLLSIQGQSHVPW